MYLIVGGEVARHLVVLLAVDRQDAEAFPAFPWEGAFLGACLEEAYLDDPVVDPWVAAWAAAFQASVLQRLEVASRDVLDTVAYLQPLGAVAASHQARVHPLPLLDLQDPVVHALQVLLLLPPYQLPSRDQDRPATKINLVSCIAHTMHCFCADNHAVEASATGAHLGSLRCFCACFVHWRWTFNRKRHDFFTPQEQQA